MSARMQHGGRPGGSRFAQFKLVLLGMFYFQECLCYPLLMLLQENQLSERCVARSALHRTTLT